jgi:signal transduction histidine kinase
VKHAAARRVEVRVASRDEGVWGMVRDDGAGFRPEEAVAPKQGTPPGTRAGIELMRRRAELFGGWLRVRSAPGSGTTVEWWLPREGAASAAIDT